MVKPLKAGSPPHLRPLVGRFITVTKLDPGEPAPFWLYDGERLLDGNGDEVVSFKDSVLRHICDPGDDARDESQAWLPPVPTHTKEAA